MVFNFDDLTPEMILVEGEINELEEKRSMKQYGLEGLYDTGFMYQDKRQAQGEQKMKLPTKKTTSTIDVAKLRVTMHGPPKIGKTTTLSKIDDMLIIATEGGHDHISGFIQPVDSWTKFLEVAKAISKKDHEFKTIAIDTIDNLVQFCREHVLTANKATHESDLPFGKGWSLVDGEFKRVFSKLTNMGLGVWFISHTIEKEVENYLGKKYTKKIPSLPNKQRNFILGLSDVILFADIAQNEDGKYERILRCQNSNDFEAGDRTGKLPATLPLDYGAFADCFETEETGGQSRLQQARQLVGSDDITPAIAFTHIDELRQAAQQMFDDGAVSESFSGFDTIEINTDADAVDALLHAQELFDTMEKGLQNERG